jgi:predicted transcriptional regulator
MNWWQKKAEELFKKHKIRHIPVVDGNKIVGIFELYSCGSSILCWCVDSDADSVESIVF